MQIKKTDDENYCNELANTIKKYEEIIGRPATRTRNMINELGNIGALKKLVISGEEQIGFIKLRDNDMLSETFEQLVVNFKHLFNSQYVDAAQWRLNHPYDLLKTIK